MKKFRLHFWFAVITCAGHFLGTTPPAQSPAQCVLISDAIASEISTADNISVCYDSRTGQPAGNGKPCVLGDACQH